MTPAERKRRSREMLARAQVVAFEVHLPRQVYAQLEHLQGLDQAITRNQVIEDAITAAFKRSTPKTRER